MTHGRLGQLFAGALPLHRRDPRPDAELLAHFLEGRDEAAFEALVMRHAPGVRAACRGWLRADADIDDAAQATFLVLALRAASIRNRAAVGHWLYGVAAKVARRLRRRLDRSHPLPDEIAAATPTHDGGLRDVLTEEVARLPEKYRLPVQLCYAAGLTTAEAAQRLGWPKGTVLTRLAGARQRLQKALTRRGVAPVGVGSFTVATAPVARGEWARQTARAAVALRIGGAQAGIVVPQRTMTLTQGVDRAMTLNRLKYVALAALLAVGLAGLGVRQLASAANGGQPPGTTPAGTTRDVVKADQPRPGPAVRRREAVIRLPSGTFVKEVEAPPYGSGRLAWTYEDERVLGRIEGSVMGVEFEVATEAEYSLSSNGTIYGLLTSVRLERVRLPDGKEFEQLRPFVGMWSAAEPLVNEVTTDLPFSYQFRVQGDRLVISNFRMLLAGPNPLGKLGGIAAKNNELTVLTYFQALGAAVEGTYTAGELREKPAPKRRLRGAAAR